MCRRSGDLRDLTARAHRGDGRRLRRDCATRLRGVPANWVSTSSSAESARSPESLSPPIPKRHEDDPSAPGLASLFHLACANEGVLIGPGGILTVSTAHDAAAISFAIAGLSAALEQIAELAVLD